MGQITMRNQYGLIDDFKTINIIVDTIDDLYNTDIHVYNEGRELLAFVKNYNTNGSGAFFTYNWDNNSWIFLILDSHTHNNINILNQLGNADIEFNGDENKYITIDKNNIIHYISDNNTKFPDDPEINDNRKLFLSVDKNGKKEWNILSSPQTFKILKFKVTEDNIDGEASKYLKLSREYLDNNKFYYDELLGDEIIVFDSGSLTEDINVEYNNDMIIHINNDKEYSMFELGESIVIILLRCGVSGLINTLDHEYVSKADLINYISNGTIDLNNYATKKFVKNNYSTKDHIHNQYIDKNDYNDLDYRYALYRHNHDEYITKQEVISLLQSLCDSDGNIDANNNLTKLTNELTVFVNNRLSEYLTAKQTVNLLNKRIDELEEKIHQLENK